MLKPRVKIRLAVLMPALISVALLAPSGASARTSAGASFNGTSDFSAFQVDGSIDLGAAHQWEAAANVGHQRSSLGGMTSDAQLLNAGATYHPTFFNDVHGMLNYWKDTVNSVHYLGPSVGFSQNFIDERRGAKLFSFTLDNDVYFFGADLQVNLVDPYSDPRNPRTISFADTLTTTQIHPNLTLEEPFLNERLSLFVTVGHDFYTTDPREIAWAMSAAAVRFSALGGLASLAGGLMKNNWSAGTTAFLSQQTRARFEFSRMQSALDDSWGSSYNLRLEHFLNTHWMASAAWNLSVQYNFPVHFGTLGLRYFF